MRIVAGVAMSAFPGGSAVPVRVGICNAIRSTVETVATHARPGTRAAAESAPRSAQTRTVRTVATRVQTGGIAALEHAGTSRQIINTAEPATLLAQAERSACRGSVFVPTQLPWSAMEHVETH